MKEINLFDSQFAHSSTNTSSDLINNSFRWVKNYRDFDGITVFTDDEIFNNVVDNVNSKYKIGWLCESKIVKPYTIDFIKSIQHKYDYILTHDKELIDLDPNKFLYNISAVWIAPFPEKDVLLYDNKTKLVSFSYSPKNSVSGWRLRHEIGRRFDDKIDIMGTGHGKPFPTFEKVLQFKDYMFAVIVENHNYDYYYSEKFLEPFWAGTIPIYWGGSHDSEQLKKIFNLNTDSIIQFKNLDELDDILNNLTPELYYSKLESIKHNFNVLTQSKYRLGAEEFMYQTYFKDYFELGYLPKLTSVII